MDTSTANILSVIVPALLAWFGGLYWLDKRHREDMSEYKEDMSKLDDRHREDMKASEEQWKWLDQKHMEARKESEERWKWLDQKHMEARKESEERWKWLFERTDQKLAAVEAKHTNNL